MSAVSCGFAMEERSGFIGPTGNEAAMRVEGARLQARREHCKSHGFNR